MDGNYRRAFIEDLNWYNIIRVLENEATYTWEEFENWQWVNTVDGVDMVDVNSIWATMMSRLPDLEKVEASKGDDEAAAPEKQEGKSAVGAKDSQDGGARST